MGQVTNLSGTWNGTATAVGGNIKLKYSLEQDGNKLSGYLDSEYFKANGTSRKRIEGEINGAGVMLREVEYINRKDNSCLATAELQMESDGTNLILSGKWKGDWKLTTCPPVAGGSIVVYRSLGQIAAPQSQVTTTKMPAEQTLPELDTGPADDIGKALISELEKRKYFALCIGMSDYQDDQIEDLGMPIEDARRLALTLTDYYDFDKEIVKVLENPTRTELIQELDRLSQVVTDKDNLVIFYAGHGVWNEKMQQGYWLPSDAVKNSKANWLSNSTIRDYLRGIPAKHTLLISDACFSGGIFKDRALQESSRAMLEMYKLPSRKAMTSGTMTTVPDNSVFIHYLIKNLENNTQKLISADQLFRTFKVAVIHNSPTGQLPQYGVIREAGDEGGDFIFLRK